MSGNLKTGTCLDDDAQYEVIAEIEGGAFGKTFIIRDHKIFFSLLKVFSKRSAATDAEREKRYLQQCQSKFIPKYLDSKLDDKNPWILMDYIPGITLEKYLSSIEEGKEMDWDVFFKIAIMLIHQISDLHSQKLIHRDLKPSNILIDGFMRPHIIDLGEVGDSTTDITGAHGTIQFESKHALLGVKNASVDVYAFAVTLFNMITGHLPFDSYYPITEGEARKPKGGQGKTMLDAYEDYLDAIEILKEAKERNENVQEKEEDVQEKKEIMDEEFKNFIKDSVRQGNHDDTYEETSEEFKKLSQRKREIMTLVNSIINSDGDLFSLEEVEEQLKEIMKSDLFESNLYDDIMRELEETDKLGDEWFGTFEYLNKAKAAGFDHHDISIRKCLEKFDPSYVYDKKRECTARNKFRFALKTETARSPPQ